eukprot:comp24046_c0_seq1/m.43132 comp24046_c0_seq1/g.43132  ORF comp24046_c0_seq1/g.43132 comp24046_c0_seq1/m.43132 type:complete len:600 (-) comp24046_c0_seq1:168-1967(-)
MSGTLKHVYACLPATKRGQNILPGGDPKGKNMLYTCGSSVVIRNIKNPAEAELYNEHAAETTVARYAPSGFYIASADITGKVKIWDTTNVEHLLKYEYQPLSGPVKDLVWSDDSKRIIVAGDGREKFGAAFLWDSGSSVGEISGHSKAINSIDLKQSRPYRAATASEDCQSAFFQGPPFKFSHSHKDHTRFVNCVRFSPDGNFYATASSDGQVFLYDGKTGEKKGQIGEPAHKGSVMGLAWSPDSKQLLTASADKTVKLWNIESPATCATTFTFGDTVEDQQLGCLWQGDDMLTISLSGFINYLDTANPDKPRRVVQGHNKLITALAVSSDGKSIFSGDYSGRIVRWDVEGGNAVAIGGNGHTNQINQLVAAGDRLWSCGMDDAILSTSADAAAYDGSKVATEACPQGLAVRGDSVVVATVKGLELYRAGQRVASKSVDWDPLCVAISPDGATAAVGGKDSKVHIFSISDSGLEETKAVDAKGQVTCLAYSPNGSRLATGDSGRNIFVWSVPAYEKEISGWVFHSAKVNSLAWAPSGNYIVSGGLDTNIFVWSIQTPSKRIQIKNAHVGSVNCVDWLGEDTIVSGGQDSTVKTWTIKHE